jgi:hypothetical protein
MFPNFTVPVIVGDDDIYLDAKPITPSTGVHMHQSLPPPSPLHDKSLSFCHQVLQFQEDIEKESPHLDKLLLQLKDFYTTVKTKCQLNMEVPPGFRQTSQHQQAVEYSRQLLGTSLEPSPLDPPTTDFLSSLSNYDNNLQMTLESPSTSDLVENTNLTTDRV